MGGTSRGHARAGARGLVALLVIGLVGAGAAPLRVAARGGPGLPPGPIPLEGQWVAGSPGAGAPDARWASAAFDTALGAAVLFGGLSPAGDAEADTWTFKNAQWTQAGPAASPPARFGGAMAYDPTHRVIVLFGGCCDAAGLPLSDTWTFDGTRWTQALAPGPPGRFEAAMAAQPWAGNVVLFGGAASAAGAGVSTVPSQPLGDTWAWDGTKWAPASSGTVPPPARWGAGLAADPTYKVSVLYGGQGGGGLLNDTWIWTGQGWAQDSVHQTSPTARRDAVTGFDAADSAGTVVMAGGTGPAGPLSDTWQFNGFKWILETPVSGAPAAAHAAAWFTPQAVAVYGGAAPDGSASHSLETWVEPPGSPQGVTVTPSDGAISVGWSVPASDGGGGLPSDYVVQALAQGLREDAGPAYAHVLQNVVNGATYSISVAGVDAAGMGLASNSITVVPRSDQAVGSITLQASSASATLPGQILLTASGMTDDRGLPVGGQTVAFSVTPSGGGAAAIEAGTSIGGSSEIALDAAAAGAPGSYTITASSGSANSNSVSVDITLGSIKPFAISAPDVDAGAAENLSVTGVQTADGTAVDGVAATLTVSSGGPPILRASVPLVAGRGELDIPAATITRTGVYAVTAVVGNTLASTIFTVSGAPAATIALTLTPAHPSQTGKVTFAVQARDRYGNLTVQPPSYSITTTDPAGRRYTVGNYMNRTSSMEGVQTAVPGSYALRLTAGALSLSTAFTVNPG